MRKNLLLLFLLIIIQSCQSDLLIDNKSIIKNIDKLNFSKTTFEVSIDDDENIIDTLSIVKTKTDENKKVLYDIKEYFHKNGNLTQQTYYRNNEDLFYRETSSGKEWKSIFQTFVNKDNVIDNAQMISYDSEGSNDTIYMKYDYKYNSKGKKEALLITSIEDSIKSINITKFNENEKSEFGYIIIESDTLQKRKMKYLNGKMIESTFEFKEPFRIKISTYDNNENIKTETLFIKVNDTIKKLSESTFHNNENTELIITKDILNDTITKRKKITAYKHR